MAKKKRGQGEGSIFEERPGKWRATLSLGWQNGRRVRKVFTAKTRAEVQQKLTKALRDRQQGMPVTANHLTLGAFLDGWLKEVATPAVRPKTLRTYSDLIELHIKPGLGKKPLAKLTPYRSGRS